MPQMNRALPKKSTIIKNLLEREDDMSLAVKTVDGGELRIYWETGSIVHLKASRELLELMGREELYAFVEDICHWQVKRFSRNTFAFETYYPSRDVKRAERMAEKRRAAEPIDPGERREDGRRRW